MINYTDITADMQISLDIILESVGILMGYEQGKSLWHTVINTLLSQWLPGGS